MAILTEKTFEVVAYSFIGSVFYHLDWEHGRVQAEMVLATILTRRQQEVNCHTE